MDTQKVLMEEPEELVYRRLYAPVSVRELLKTADGRSRIRRLPLTHLFFGLKELEEEDRVRLLPHVTEEQWTGILDLALWSRDRVSVGALLSWQEHILRAEDAVARKLIRATDPELWELAFKRELRIHARTGEDEYEGQVEAGASFVTPDQEFLMVLPGDPDRARILHRLVLRLYELDFAFAGVLLASSLARTSVELEETAYQRRKHRVQDLGFQDYFEAIEIYTDRDPRDRLPEKQWEPIREVSPLPAGGLGQGSPDVLLLFQALARVSPVQNLQALLEELLFVCNKVLTADRISAADSERVKQGIRKAILGINLGLDCWAEGELARAMDGIRRHYLQTFFQLGYGRLMDLRRQAVKARELPRRPQPGSPEEAFLEALCRKYPLLAERKGDRIRPRFFKSRFDLKAAQRELDRLSAFRSPP